MYLLLRVLLYISQSMNEWDLSAFQSIDLNLRLFLLNRLAMVSEKV